MWCVCCLVNRREGRHASRSQDPAAQFCGVGNIDDDFNRNAEVPADLISFPPGVGKGAIVGGMVSDTVVA